jgi:membrane dipeptidase
VKLGVALLTVALLCGCRCREASTPPPPAAKRSISPDTVSARPKPDAGFDPASLHHEALVIDTHCDVTLRLMGSPAYDLGKRNSAGHVDLVRMKEGGLDAEFLAVWVDPYRFKGRQLWARAMRMFDAIHAAVKRYPSLARLALSAADVERTVGEGKLALLIGVEGGHAIGDFSSEKVVLDRLKELHRRGARYLTLTWMTSNPLAGSSGDEGRAGGLTALGRRVVRTMNDLGMMVDLSHVSDRTFFDALEISRSPVIASHSSMRHLAKQVRNVSDEMLRALKKNGGVVCVNFFSGFLEDRWMRELKRVGKEGKHRIKRSELGVLADHIDHAVKVAGVDHVCLGSDFDGISAPPVGLEDASKLPALTAELARRGYSARDLRKVLGQNVLRVMRENERRARRQQKNTR